MGILKFFALFLCLTAVAAEVPGDESGGIGVVLDIVGQEIIVTHIFPYSPAAAQKDLHVGDRIIAIAQDKSPAVQVQGGKLTSVLHLIRGPRGTTVRLTIVSPGQDASRTRVVSFVRGEVMELSRWGDGALPTNGTIAPDIKMLNLADGTPERLSDYAGKIVVLEFWASWSQPCQQKIAGLQTWFSKHPDWKGKVVLIAASVDYDPEAAVEHLKTKGWAKTHNVWVGTEARKACHIDVIPTAYIIDRQRRIVAVDPVDIPELVNHELQIKGK